MLMRLLPAHWFIGCSLPAHWLRLLLRLLLLLALPPPASRLPRLAPAALRLRSVLAVTAVKQGKGSVFTAKAVKTRSKGGVFAVQVPWQPAPAGILLAGWRR